MAEDPRVEAAAKEMHWLDHTTSRDIDYYRSLAAIALKAMNKVSPSSADYEQGYKDGGSSFANDYVFALDEYCDAPEDLDAESPTKVAAYIQSLIEERDQWRKRAEDRLRLEGWRCFYSYSPSTLLDGPFCDYCFPIYSVVS